MSVGENFANIIFTGECVTEVCKAEKLAREIQPTDWSTAGNLSNRSSGVQIPRDICTRFGRYLYSTKCSWIKTAKCKENNMADKIRQVQNREIDNEHKQSSSTLP